MTGESRAGWRWSNVPVPEPHVAGLLVGTVLHLLRPVRAFEDRRLARPAGRGLIGIGLLTVGWAVRTAGAVDVEGPAELVTAGPYAFSRNPMYVGWTALYLGVALVVNSVWLFAVLPGVAGACHWIVRREERSLEREFGAAYRAYRRDVRRYL